MKPFISLCMVVKDEEKLLERCLKSVKLYVDEIIIVDTGSTDNTVEIAKKYTDNVYFFKWINDFSKARNFAQSFATGEWIIYLDADEYVEEENFKTSIQLLKDTPQDNCNDAYVVNQINLMGDSYQNIGKCPTTRIYKNQEYLKFNRRIHEQLVKEKSNFIIGSIDLNIYHTGYVSEIIERKNKSKRNIDLILLELKENESSFDYYNLANEYLALEKIELALKYYFKAYNSEENKKKLWIPLNVERLIYCLIDLKKYNDAEKVVNEAISEWGNIVDFQSQKGIIKFLKNELNDSIEIFEEVIKPKKRMEVLANFTYRDFIPYSFLGQMYFKNGDIQRSIENYSKAVKFNKEDISVLSNFYKILIDNVSGKEFIDFVDRNIIKNDIDKSRLLKIVVEKGEINLFKEIMSFYNVKYTPSINFKLNLIEGKYNICSLILKNNGLELLFGDGWTDKHDVFMLFLINKKVQIIDKLMEYSKKNNTIFLNTKKNYGLDSQNIYMLVEKCISLKKYDVIDQLFLELDISNISIEIGNIFYEHNFKEIALDFYFSADDKIKYDTETIKARIIPYYKEIKDIENLRYWEQMII